VRREFLYHDGITVIGVIFWDGTSVSSQTPLFADIAKPFNAFLFRPPACHSSLLQALPCMRVCCQESLHFHKYTLDLAINHLSPLFMREKLPSSIQAALRGSKPQRHSITQPRKECFTDFRSAALRAVQLSKHSRANYTALFSRASSNNSPCHTAKILPRFNSAQSTPLICWPCTRRMSSCANKAGCQRVARRRAVTKRSDAGVGRSMISPSRTTLVPH
jgi:hypothetical protein